MGQSDIQDNLEIVQRRIANACRCSGRSPAEITLVAVTKTVSPETVEVAYNLGVRHFGENRVQEAEPKIKALAFHHPSLIWHMIGHLQSNKMKNALNLFDVIQSVDSIRLAESIINLATPGKMTFLQVNVAGEKTKGGFSLDDIEKILQTPHFSNKLNVRGLMTVAPLVEDPEEVRPVFRKLREIRDRFGLEHLSMGMTNDFEVAIQEGSTMVRIGRGIFGERK